MKEFEIKTRCHDTRCHYRMYPCRALAHRRFTAESFKTATDPLSAAPARTNTALTLHIPQLPQTQQLQSLSDVAFVPAVSCSELAPPPTVQQVYEHHFVYFSFDRAPIVRHAASAHADASSGGASEAECTSAVKQARAEHYAKAAQRWAHSYAQQPPTSQNAAQSDALRTQRVAASSSRAGGHVDGSIGSPAKPTGTADQLHADSPSPQHFVPCRMSMEDSFQQQVGITQWASVPLREMLVEDYIFSMRSLLCYAPKRASRWILPQLSVREATFSVLLCFQRLLAQAKGDKQCTNAAKAVFRLRCITSMVEFDIYWYKTRNTVNSKRLHRAFTRMQTLWGPEKHRTEALQLISATEQLMRSGIRITAFDVSSMQSFDDLLQTRQKWSVNRITNDSNFPREASKSFHESSSGVSAHGEELASTGGEESKRDESALGSQTEAVGALGSHPGGGGDVNFVAVNDSKGEEMGLPKWSLERVSNRVPRFSEVWSPIDLFVNMCLLLLCMCVCQMGIFSAVQWNNS